MIVENRRRENIQHASQIRHPIFSKKFSNFANCWIISLFFSQLQFLLTLNKQQQQSLHKVLTFLSRKHDQNNEVKCYCLILRAECTSTLWTIFQVVTNHDHKVIHKQTENFLTTIDYNWVRKMGSKWLNDFFILLRVWLVQNTLWKFIAV